MELELSFNCAKPQIFESARLAGNPGRRPFVFSAIDDLAFLAAGNKFENDLFAAIQACPSVILGGGKDQPMPFQYFVRPALSKNLIAAIRIHFQGGSLAMVRFPCDFNAYAIISPFQGRLRLCRLATDDQAYSAHEKDFCQAVERPVMVCHS
jgi:hypothetical protein